MFFRSNHGFYEEERIKGNDFWIDVEVVVEKFDSIDDDIKDTVNYEEIYAICKDEMANSRKLLETVVMAISLRIKELDHIACGVVKLQKANPPLGGQVESAQVKIEF